MVRDKWVSLRISLQRLEKAGFTMDAPIKRFLQTKRGIRLHDLETVETAARLMGANNVYNFFWGLPFSASRQLKKKRFEKMGLRRSSFRKKAIFMLEAFSKHLGKIINQSLLARKGYRIQITSSIDLPFYFALTIAQGEQVVNPVARFNFDLFFNKNGKPSAFLGNMQGGHLKDIKRFRQRTGKSPLDFFIGSFKKAFPSKKQLFALNVKHHQYRKPLLDYVVANSMERRGKLTPKQNSSIQKFLNYGELVFDPKDFLYEEAGHPTRQHMRQLIGLVKKEKQRIVTQTTGAHKAAYKKAGFKLTKSRAWRMRK